ncbi:MAG: hypothetical protein RSA79_01580 [Oscillospiraceae bacterium]
MKADLNFYTSYRATNKQLTLKSRVTKMVSVLVIVIVGSIVFSTLVLAGINAKGKKDIKDLQAEIESQKAVAAQIELQKAALANVNKKKDAIKDVQVTKMLDRMLTKEEITKIYACLTPDTFIQGATYVKSSLNLSCTADSKDSPSLCAETLNKAGIATTVRYVGFTSEEKTEGPPKYKFTLECRVKYSDGLVQYLSDQIAIKEKAEKAAKKAEADKKAAEAKAASETEKGGDK